jgi:hypothetical protein
MLHLAVAVALFSLVGFFANAHLPAPYHQGVKQSDYTGPDVLEGWVRFDAGWYSDIVKHGYFFREDKEQSSVAFFPGYPLSIRAVHNVFGGDVAVAGIAITFLSGLLITLLFYRWCVPRVGPRAALYSLAALLLWPYAWYLFGAVYADALFIALVIGAFTLLEMDHVVAATVVGALATATRPVGMAVAVGLLVRQLERRGVISWPRLDAPLRSALRRTPAPEPVPADHAGASGNPPTAKPPWLRIDRRRFRVVDLFCVFSLAGLVAYVAYLHATFGNAFAFVKAEAAPGWGNTNDAHAWFKVEFFRRLVHFPHQGAYYTTGIAFQAVLAIFALSLAPKVGRKFGWGYAVFVVVVLAIPLAGSKDFQGLGRYALSAFPVFAVLGDVLARRPRLAAGVLVVSAGLLGFLCSAFARGAYVA